MSEVLCFSSKTLTFLKGKLLYLKQLQLVTELNNSKLSFIIYSEVLSNINEKEKPSNRYAQLFTVNLWKLHICVARIVRKIDRYIFVTFVVITFQLIYSTTVCPWMNYMERRRTIFFFFTDGENQKMLLILLRLLCQTINNYNARNPSIFYDMSRFCAFLQ